jgi:hypothetical protein
VAVNVQIGTTPKMRDMTFSLKFFPLKDLFYSVFPTVGAYGGYINGFAPDIFANIWVAVGIGLAASVILAMIFHADNVKSYKKSLAEILATGYFINFTGRLGKLLKSKVPIDFVFPDNGVKTFVPDNIRVEVGMPKSPSSLTSFCEDVERSADIIYVRESSLSEPYWLRARVEGETLVIYEFPRTLFSLSKYLRDEFADREKAEAQSKKMYAFFAKKIEQLRIEHANEISNDSLNFIAV